MLIPRLVISFRENYDEDRQPSRHGGNAQQTVRSERMAFERRALTDDFEVQTVDRAGPSRVGESAQVKETTDVS